MAFDNFERTGKEFFLVHLNNIIVDITWIEQQPRRKSVGLVCAYVEILGHVVAQLVEALR